MKLSQLSAKPVLTQIILDDEDTMRQYGEPIDFWTWDRQPMDIFMKLASATQENTSGIINVVKTLILDENGKEILTNETMLPTNILMKAISKVTEMLGK
jgi:hypothetical protein